ncbi:MAG: ADOP family duplicated permease [Bryobacteraceae bacterium]|nr:ADOP family duplicated permease [Bryobacteraceae bacterium]
MEWFRKLITRAAGWAAGTDADAEMAEEIRLHQQERAEELQRAGLSAQDAGRQARHEFGGALRAMEDSRSAWHLGWIEDLSTDLRYAARALVHDRTFAVTAMVSLALGIGVNTTIFSLAAEFLFSEPSVRDASTLAAVRLGGNSHADPEEFDYLRETGIFAGVTGYRDGEVNWRHGEISRRLFAFRVDPDFFQLLGVPLHAGRPIEPGDRDVALASHRFWRTALNADPAALNRTLTIDGRPHTLIGILPERHRTVFGFGLSPDLYLPVETERGRLALYVRLRPGVSRPEALERTRAAAKELDRRYPGPHYKRAGRVEVVGLAGLEWLGNRKMVPLATFFAMLLAAVNLVLLIACVNVASLMLARASARTQELAIRASIGAGRGRIVRQLLAESLLLAMVATGAGIALNLLLTGLLNDVALPIPAPIRLQIQPDWRLLIYSVAIALGSAVAAGLLPALQAARFAGPSALLNRGNRQAGSGSRLRSVLVTAQVAVTFLVLATAILFLRNLARSSAINPGFEVDRLVWASMRIVPERYPSGESVAPLVAAALQRLRALPGVEAASAVRVVPFNDQETHGGAIRVDGVEVPISRIHNQVSPGYFHTMGIGMVDGREFQERESGVAVVNEEFARRVFGPANAVGRTIQLFGGRAITITGICRNTKFMTIGEDDKPALYEPYTVADGDRRHKLAWMIRTRTSPAGLVRASEQALLDLDPAAAVEAKPMQSAMGFALLPSQLGAGLMGAMGLLGLTLASIGLYGVLVYGVARRRREIGVRMALGARTTDVLGLVLRDAAWIMGVGMAIGSAASFFVTRPLTMFLVSGLTPADPLSYVSVAAVLALVAMAASLAPSLRAIHVNPTEALRSE